MENKSDIGSTAHFLRKNWVMLMWIVGAIFALGGIFAEFQSLQSQQNSDKLLLQNEIDDLQQRQEKKIKVQNGIDDRVDEIEEYISWEQGREQGRKEALEEHKNSKK